MACPVASSNVIGHKPRGFELIGCREQFGELARIHDLFTIVRKFVKFI